MNHIHLWLALAALAIVAVVIVQDHLVPALQSKSISSGLTGPYHWYLDGAFVALAVALALAFRGSALLQQILASGAAFFLVLTGASGTWTDWLDQRTNGQGEKIHAACTAVTFVLALGLQVASDRTSACGG